MTAEPAPEGSPADITARRVWEVRTDADWTQADLAASMRDRGHGWHQSTVARVEAAIQVLRVDELADLAGIFGVPLEALLRDDVMRPVA